MQDADNLKTFLKKAYGKEPSDKKVAEYKDRLVKFFSLLAEIDQRNRKKANEAKNN